MSKLDGKKALPQQHRTANIEKRVKDKDKDEYKRYDLSFASDEPYLRWYGYEVLRIDEDNFKLDRHKEGAPFLNDHDNSVESVIGLVEKAWIDGNVARATVIMDDSPEAESVMSKIDRGFLSKISVGYSVDAMERAEDDAEDGEAVYNVSSTPREISLVAVPADDTVGIGRAEDAVEFPFTLSERQAEAPVEQAASEQIAEEVNNLNSSPKNVRVELKDNAPTGNVKVSEETKTDESVSAVEAGQKYVADMIAIGERFGHPKICLLYTSPSPRD